MPRELCNAHKRIRVPYIPLCEVTGEMILSYFLSRTLFLVVGTLYPAYSSFKAVRTKNPRAYVKWMMYWIVFACYLLVENFTDSFLSWVPFYYEMKILVILWMVLPMTRGSSYLYRSWIHPFLKKHEPRIDEGLSQVSQTGVTMLRRASIVGFNLATQTVVTGAIKGHEALGEALGRPSTSEPPATVNERSTPPGGDEEFLIIALDEGEDEVVPAVASNSGMAYPVQSVGRQEDEVGIPPREEMVGLPPREGTPPRETRRSRRKQ